MSRDASLPLLFQRCRAVNCGVASSPWSVAGAARSCSSYSLKFTIRSKGMQLIPGIYSMCFPIIHQRRLKFHNGSSGNLREWRLPIGQQQLVALRKKYLTQFFPKLLRTVKSDFHGSDFHLIISSRLSLWADLKKKPNIRSRMKSFIYFATP